MHDSLKKAAEDPKANGLYQLHTSSKVISLDPNTATVTLENGSTIECDLVVAADGVHSVGRLFVPGGNVKPFSSGKSAFRFLVPREKAAEDAMTREFVKNPGDLIIWYGSDRRIVMYPTSNNSMLNFVCIHPEIETADASGKGWNQTGHLEKLLHVYKSFSPAVLKLLGKADPQTIKIWTLLDMEVIPTWTNQRLGLLGDSAHPFLPHQGQGAGVAIEDAASLAAVLPAGTRPEEVPERLKLYENIRKVRADRIQQHSRIAGKDLDEKKDSDSKHLTGLV